jgi:hypothetical protein
MKNRFSSVSNANCYKNLRGVECKWKNIIGPNAGTYDVIENDYYSRSTINDEILKKKHILFLGDSFVFGHGLTHTDTMGVHFEELLNNDEYCVINLGVPGSSYEHAYLRLQQWCNQFGDNIHSVYFGLTHPFRKMHIIDYALDVDITFENLYDSTTNIDIVDFLIDQKPYDYGDVLLAHRDFYKYTTSRPAIDILAQWDRQVAMLKTQSKAYRFNTCTFQTASLGVSPSEHRTIKQHADVLEGFPKFTYGLREMSDKGLNDSHLIDPKNNRHWNGLGNKQVAFNLLRETKHWYD